ncbi:MAG: hypothetical protein Q9188_003179 [Gyalolechia gomerana]
MYSYFDGRLQWKRKPEPYGIKFPKKTYIQSWKAMEAQTHKELWNAVAKARFRPVGHEDADEILKIDLAAKAAFARSRLQSRRDSALLELERNQQLTFSDKDARNEYLASSTGLLRGIPDMCMYLALDKNSQVLVHLDPSGVERAFGKKIKARMERDSILFYYYKPPTRNFNKRHASTCEEGNRNRNHLSEHQCGTDRYGHRHPTGDNNGVICETKETNTLHNYDGQLCYHYRRTSSLRKEYRQVYKRSPEAARLAPTNGPKHRETYCFRAVLINMPNNEHVDETDWKGGLTGLVQIGKFQGAAMALKQLGIVLPGYRSGASLQFRGNILSHFITRWNGKCRFAIDHTTKDTVSHWVEDKKRAKAQRKASRRGTSEESDTDSDDSSGSDDQDEPESIVCPSLATDMDPSTKRKREIDAMLDAAEEANARQPPPPPSTIDITDDEVEFLCSKPIPHQR